MKEEIYEDGKRIRIGKYEFPYVDGFYTYKNDIKFIWMSEDKEYNGKHYFIAEVDRDTQILFDSDGNVLLKRKSLGFTNEYDYILSIDSDTNNLYMYSFDLIKYPPIDYELSHLILKKLNQMTPGCNGSNVFYTPSLYEEIKKGKGNVYIRNKYKDLLIGEEE